MKKILISAFLIMSALSFGKIVTKEGTAFAFKGDMTVAVEMDGKKIVSIKVLKHEDTPKYADPAIEEVSAAIIEKQSTDVDGMAGATYTSLGLKEAVKNAMKKK